MIERVVLVQIQRRLRLGVAVAVRVLDAVQIAMLGQKIKLLVRPERKHRWPLRVLWAGVNLGAETLWHS
jgi:hypothetical protein